MAKVGGEMRVYRVTPEAAQLLAGKRVDITRRVLSYESVSDLDVAVLTTVLAGASTVSEILESLRSARRGGVATETLAIKYLDVSVIETSLTYLVRQRLIVMTEPLPGEQSVSSMAQSLTLREMVSKAISSGVRLTVVAQRDSCTDHSGWLVMRPEWSDKRYCYGVDKIYCRKCATWWRTKTPLTDISDSPLNEAGGTEQ